MNISYEQLKTYVDTDYTVEQIAETLTSIGLETGSVETVESIPGGLRGLVIGEVLRCEKHENSDHLHVTEVSIGNEVLQIVCGAPNVAVGYAVVVATIGTVLGQGEERFTIKKGKIRGVESYGMLCSEREIGVGSDDSGIILLPLEAVRIGQTAAEYYGIKTDQVLEVDITPNRVDATSHYGVARDLAAYLSLHERPTEARLPEVKALPEGKCPIGVSVEVGAEWVSRFQGVVVRGLEVKASPEWLRFRLESIGQKPINNVVDITNYVLHEYGQPLHAYDIDKVVGNALRVGFAREGSRMLMLDHEERELSSEDLVISDAEGKPLCLAGVMGGELSGTTEATQAIFLEAAGFNASSVRKSARRHGLNTDSSFRFERGLDEGRTSWALARAVSLILELCPGAYVDGGVLDHYPEPQAPFAVSLSLDRMYRLIGKVIPTETVRCILKGLEIDVLSEAGDVWHLAVPRYRVDVQRDVDVIEEVMRIYGYNQIEMSTYIHANLSSQSESDRSYKRRLLISEQLVGAGFNEILCNSLTAESLYEGLSSHPARALVRLVNPLSAELGVMRSTLLFGGLQSISRNLRRQAKRFYFFEWGNVYRYEATEDEAPTMQSYQESLCLGLWLGGYRVQAHWAHADEGVSPFEVKGHVQHILRRLGINVGLLRYNEVDCDLFEGKALEITAEGGRLLVGRLGQVRSSLSKAQDIDIPIYFAELEWATLQRLAERAKVSILDLPKYPMVRRDLSLLIDESVRFVDIEAVAYKSEKKLLQKCELFDVYEGKNLPSGKKSYAVAFYLQDESQTMSEGQIEGIMAKIQKNIEAQLGASLR